jgi:hypothetical protein
MNFVWGIHSRYFDQSIHFLNISLVAWREFSFAVFAASSYSFSLISSQFSAAISLVNSRGNP